MTSKLKEVEDGVEEDGPETGSQEEEAENHLDTIVDDEGTVTPRNLEDVLDELRDRDGSDHDLPTFADGFSKVRRAESDDTVSIDPQESVIPSIERDSGSPDGSVSIPDDTPSLQVSDTTF